MMQMFIQANEKPSNA